MQTEYVIEFLHPFDRGFVEGLTAVKVRGKRLNSNIEQVKSETIVNLKRFYFAFFRAWLL